MEHDSSVSDIPLPGEEAKSKEIERTNSSMQPEKIDESKTGSDQSSQDTETNIQLTANLESSDHCSKITLKQNEEESNLVDKHSTNEQISDVQSQEISVATIIECSNEIVETVSEPIVQSNEHTILDCSKLSDQDVQPDDNTDPPDSSEPKEVTVTVISETSVNQQIDPDVQAKSDVCVETEDIESDLSLHISLDSSDLREKVQPESSVQSEPVDVLQVVQNVANINEISEGMECELLVEQIEEMQPNQIVHESIVTSEVSETVAQSAVQVGVAETVVAQPVELNSYQSNSSDEQETEEDSKSITYLNGVLESTNETSHDSTTPASPVPPNENPEIIEPVAVSDATGTINSEPESSLDDTEDDSMSQESSTEQKKMQTNTDTETSVKNVQEPDISTPQDSEPAVSSKDDETTVGSAEGSDETDNSDHIEISEVKLESADSNSDKIKDEIETCSTEEMTILNEPVISFTPSECDTNEKTDMDTNSNSEDIVEAFLIEEVSDEVGESSTTSPQSEPIIVEPGSDDIVQNNEFNQMTEVLVLETVSEEAAMEVDGTLTASVAENVMIEIIDNSKSIYKSKDIHVSIEIIEEREIEDGTEHNPDIIQEVTLESKDTGDVVKEESDPVIEVSAIKNVLEEEKYIEQNVAHVQESLSDSGTGKTVSIIEDTVEEASVDNSAQVKSEPKGPKIQEKRSRVTRSSHARSVSDVPCHVLGRNIDNPTEDLISNGRTPPKPRLGVKVPYRFLTSQIVSKQDLADELLELVAKRNPDPDPPAGGDIFFAQKLTQRLANKIAMSESKRLKQQATAKISSVISEKASGSSTLTSGIPDDALSTPPPSETSTSNSTSKIVDNSDLLAILEGDVDVDWTKEIRKNDGASTKTSEPETVAPPVLTPENVVTANTAATNTPPKLESPITSFSHSSKKNLDPEIERQLALKQLQEFPKEGGRRDRRSLKYIPPPLRKPVQEVPKVRKENVPVVQTPKEQSAPVPVISNPTECQKQTVVKYKKIIEKQMDKGKKPKETASKKSVDSSTKTKDDITLTNKESKPVVSDIIEPTLTARKVMKTYSRKETILKVPAELEYIVNDSDTSALTETGEAELPQESLPGPSNIKSEIVESDLYSSKKVSDEAAVNPKLNEIADNDEGILVKDNVEKVNEEIVEKNVSECEKQETNKKEEAPQPASGSGKKTVNKTATKKAPQIKRAKRSIAEINKPEVTLVSKRARIIKKRVIWDPAEVPKARATVGAKKPQSISTKPTTLKADKQYIPEKVNEVKEEKKTQNEPVPEVKSEKQTVEKDEEKLSNGQSESKIPSITKGKLLSRVALSKKAKKLLMKRKLRPLKSKLIRASRGELKKSLALSKKKKQVLVEIAKKVNKPKKTELDRLLMDEGAVNMLYSVKRDQKLHGDITKTVISLDRAQKDLINRTKVVKDVITQSSNQEDTPKALRKKDSPTLTLTSIQTSPRKKSRDSIRSSLQSPPPSPSYIYPPRPEASRIIRRHSSSFSSECSSPRRLSIDTQQQAQQPQQIIEKSEIKPDTEEQGKSKDTSLHKETPELQSPIRSLRRKGVPIYERKLDEKTYKGKKKLLSDMESKEAEDKKETSEKGTQKQEATSAKEKLSIAEKRKLNTEMSKNFSKQQLPKKRTRLSKTTDEEVPKVNEDKNVTKPASKSPAKANKKVEVTKQDSKEKQRMTTRQVSLSTAYKEISLRKIDSLVQIILTPTFTKLKNPITLQMFHELSDVLMQLSKDESCRVVLITSTDSSFCHGVDFSTLVQPNAEKRLAAAQDMAKALKEFLRSLATFPKPLVAGVQGSAVGLGVTMLPLFDLVLASDKATFSTPYGRLGHVPEGIAFLTLPNLLGSSLTSELLFANRKLTASEALHHGLVTRTLWPDKFQEELIASALTIANQSTQCVLATKALLRQSLLIKLDESLESEHKLLIEHWVSNECQQNFKTLLHEDEWW